MPVVPHRFLFRFAMPVPRIEERASGSPPFLNLDDVPALPDFGTLDDAAPFAEIRAGWNEAGIGFRVAVSGKKMPLAETPDEPRESDGFQLWLDTRNTQTIHRASRFCHHFAFLPSPSLWTPQQANRAEGSKSAKAAKAASEKGRTAPSRKAATASAHQLAIAQAKEDPPFTRAGLLRAASEPVPGGYVLDIWVPAECLTGYDPEANPLLGFYYLVRDAELGEQSLGVGREFPFDHDPSLWSTLELAR